MMEMQQLLRDTMDRISQIRVQLQTVDNKSNIINTYVSDFAKIAYTAEQSQNNRYDIDELNGKLRDLLGALENQDEDLFVDLLEFEVKPLLEYWLTLQ
jgi:hypothetical protein